MANYSDVLGRINAYREQMNMSKEAMAKMLGIYGNNYHQMEIGRRMLSMESLKLFEKNGGSLFMLFTGYPQVEGPTEQILAKCKSQEQKKRDYAVVDCKHRICELVRWQSIGAG